MARRFIIVGLGFALLGLLLGIYMAASQNHVQMVTHAHILLVGFVLNFVYGMLYRVWQLPDDNTLAKVQFYAHQIGAIVLSAGLFMLYGQIASLEVLDPILAIASLAVLAGMIIMKVQYIKHTRPDAAASD